MNNEITIEITDEKSQNLVEWRAQTRKGSRMEFNINSVAISADSKWTIIRIPADEKENDTLLFPNETDGESKPEGLRFWGNAGRMMGVKGRFTLNDLCENLNKYSNLVGEIIHEDAGRIFTVIGDKPEETI